SDWDVFNNQGGRAISGGEVINLVADFTNFLQPSSEALKAVMTTESPYAEVLVDEVTLGRLATEQTRRNAQQPFQVFVSSDAPMEEDLILRITYQDTAYQDFEFHTVTVNLSYLDITTRRITTTLTSNGRVGYLTFGPGKGSGFIYDDQSLLYEMGLIVSGQVDTLTTVTDAVRNAQGGQNDGFEATSLVRREIPAPFGDEFLRGAMNEPVDSSTLLFPLPVKIDYRGVAWENEKYVVVAYDLTNTGSNPVADVRVGLFADWDVTAFNDVARWDDVSQTGYVRSVAGGDAFVGIHPLTFPALQQYRAIDNADSQFGTLDGFTDEEKRLALSEGVTFTEAGGTNGADVAHVTGNGPFTINAGETISLLYALVAGDDLNDLRQTSMRADAAYDQVLAATPPAPKSGLRVVPNPAADGRARLFWEASRAQNWSVAWYDLTGREVQRGQSTSGTEIAVPQVPGLYVLRVSDGAITVHERVVVY
ncbi:MAG: T9SS type A sorting domain-containing protein, partial [Catalinimonas sp.]